MASGIQSHLPGLGSLHSSSHVPRRVTYFKGGLNRSVVQGPHPGPVARNMGFPVSEHGNAAASASGSHMVHVQSVAAVTVIISLLVKFINYRHPCLLAPYVRSAGNKPLPLRRRPGNCRTVNTVGRTVVFPRKIVQPLRHMTTEAHLFRRSGIQGGILQNPEIAGRSRAEIALEQQGVHPAVPIGIRQLVDNHAAVAHVKHAQPGRIPPFSGIPRNGHRFPGPENIQGVGDGNGLPPRMILTNHPFAQFTAGQKVGSGTVHLRIISGLSAIGCTQPSAPSAFTASQAACHAFRMTGRYSFSSR